MAHGTFNENIEFYSIIIERCREDTINLILGEGYNCSNALEMDEAVSHHGIVHFNFINNYVNILNYKEPVKKYFYEVENSLEKEKFVINHINFNPSIIKTNVSRVKLSSHYFTIQLLLHQHNANNFLNLQVHLLNKCIFLHYYKNHY